MEARVLALNRTRVHVRNKDDGREWSIRYCAVNVGNVDTDLRGPSREPLERLSVRVGDSVGFTTREGRDVGGRVIRLQLKHLFITVTDVVIT